jgi:hypothetical protein
VQETRVSAGTAVCLFLTKHTDDDDDDDGEDDDGRSNNF